MKLAQKLRELRDAAGLSEAKLAELSGVSFGAVHNYGLGIRQPTFAAVVRIARALNVTCDVFSECEDVAGGHGAGAELPPLAEAKSHGRPRKPIPEPAPEAPAPKGRRKKAE